MAEAPRRKGLARLLMPQVNAGEAASVSAVESYGLQSLRQAVDFLKGETPVERARPMENGSSRSLKGWTTSPTLPGNGLRSALEVTAARVHNILLYLSVSVTYSWTRLLEVEHVRKPV